MNERAADEVRKRPRRCFVLARQLYDSRQNEAVEHALGLDVQSEVVDQLLKRRVAEAAELIEQVVNDRELLLCLALALDVIEQRAVHSSVHEQLLKVLLEMIISVQQGLT